MLSFKRVTNYYGSIIPIIELLLYLMSSYQFICHYVIINEWIKK